MHAWCTTLHCCLLLSENLEQSAIIVNKVTVSTKASCSVECGSWHFDKPLVQGHCLAHLVLLHLRAFGEITAKKCVPFQCTYLRSALFILLEMSLALLFIDCKAQSVASKTVISQISHHTVKITLCCFPLHVYLIRTCFS